MLAAIVAAGPIVHGLFALLALQYGRRPESHWLWLVIPLGAIVLYLWQRRRGR
jgi:hypothetical protein